MIKSKVKGQRKIVDLLKRALEYAATAPNKSRFKLQIIQMTHYCYMLTNIFVVQKFI